jgi:hypothetical protein
MFFFDDDYDDELKKLRGSLFPDKVIWEWLNGDLTNKNGRFDPLKNCDITDITR